MKLIKNNYYFNRNFNILKSYITYFNYIIAKVQSPTRVMFEHETVLSSFNISAKITQHLTWLTHTDIMQSHGFKQYQTHKSQGSTPILPLFSQLNKALFIPRCVNIAIIDFNPSNNHLNKFYHKNPISRNTKVRQQSKRRGFYFKISTLNIQYATRENIIEIVFVWF